MNMIQMANGSKKTAMSGKTSTYTTELLKSNEHNGIRLYFIMTSGTGTWTIKLQGKSNSGEWVDCYDNLGNQMSINNVTANKSQSFVTLPHIFRIVATEEVDGATVTVDYELFSV